MTFDIEADWTLNLLCNYDCDYCFCRASTEHRLVGRISPEQYLEFFNSTGKIWLLHLTGGEPFFHPNFVGLCRTLTSRHFISVNSNLSSHRVRDFAAEIDLNATMLRWFDAWLKGIDNGVESEPPVRIFVMGSNQWVDEHEWPIARI